jgi:hypothetical protein
MSQGIPLAHVGITDPTVAPSDGPLEVRKHFGITTENIVLAMKEMR